MKWVLKALDFFDSRNIVKALSKQKAESVKFHMHNFVFAQVFVDAEVGKFPFFFRFHCITLPASGTWNEISFDVAHNIIVIGAFTG